MEIAFQVRRAAVQIYPCGTGVYSVRNAIIGLMGVARRAGSRVASKVAAASSSGAMENAIGSSAPPDAECR